MELGSGVCYGYPHSFLSFDNLELGEATLVDERVLGDAFDREFEYAAVSVQRAKAMLVSQ